MWWRIGFLGNLLKRNLVDREWLYDTFSSVIIFQWFKWEPIILQSRKSLSNPRYGDTVEYLAKEMMKMDEQKGIKRFIPKTLSYEDAHIGKIEHGRTE